MNFINYIGFVWHLYQPKSYAFNHSLCAVHILFMFSTQDAVFIKYLVYQYIQTHCTTTFNWKCDISFSRNLSHSWIDLTYYIFSGNTPKFISVHSHLIRSNTTKPYNGRAYVHTYIVLTSGFRTKVWQRQRER